MAGTVPDVAFLGLCERAIHINAGHPILWKHNIIGLRKGFTSYVYPLSLNGFQLAFAIYDLMHSEAARISVISPTGEEVVNVEIGAPGECVTEVDIQRHQIDRITQQNELVELSKSGTRFGTLVIPEQPGWSVFIHSLESLDQTISPGEYTIRLRRGSIDVALGTLYFYYVPAPPLTPERINAIRSDPFARKAVRITMACKMCKQELRAYAALEQNLTEEAQGWLWYRTLPDNFRCRCGKSTVDLTMLRESLHGLLGNPVRQDDNVSFDDLYNKGILEDTYFNFVSVLGNCKREEEVQQFIERNLVLLQQFSPEVIHPKAPILALYNTDFAILDSRGDLVLVEIERPDRRLLKERGGDHTDLQHALNQVHDWLYTVDQHRAAVLEGIGLKPEQVASVRGVVIMGRDNHYNSDRLRKLKWKDFGRITLYTYDDLLNSLISLTRRMN